MKEDYNFNNDIDSVSLYLLFGSVLSHHVAEVFFLHLGLLLSDVLLVLLRHGHGVQLQLLWSQGHLYALRLLPSARLTTCHGLKTAERKKELKHGYSIVISFGHIPVHAYTQTYLISSSNRVVLPLTRRRCVLRPSWLLLRGQFVSLGAP